MADDQIETKIIATTGDFQEAMKAAADKAKEAADKIKGSFDGLLEIVGISLTIEGIKSFIESMANLGLQTEQTMAKLGLSAEQVGLMGGAARLSGVSIDTMTNGIERMALNIQKSTRDAFNPAAQGLRNIGLSAQELQSLPTDQYFLKLAGAVEKFNPSLNLTTNLIAIGGRGMLGLLPALLQGKEHFLEFQKAVAQTGSVLSDAQSTAFAQTHEKLTLLGLSVEGLGIKLFSVLKPAIDGAVKWMTEFVQSFDADTIRTKVLQIGNYTIDIIATIRKFIVDLQAAYETLTGTLKSTGTAASTVGTALMNALNPAVAAVKSVVGLYLKLNPAAKDAGEVAATSANKAKEAIDRWVNSQKALLGLALSAPDGGEGPPKKKLDAKPINGGAKDELNATMATYQQMIKLEDDYYAQSKEKLDAAFKLGQITETEKTNQLLAELAKRTQKQQDYYDDEIALEGLSRSEIQKLENEKTQAIQKAVLERQKIIDKSNEDQAKKWGQAGADIAGAFNSQLRRLLAHTTSWAQAMKNIMGDLVVKWIGDLTTMAAKWLGTQLFMTTATTAGVAERTAAEETGLAAQMGVAIAKALKSIAASAEETFAGIFAFLSPEMGPAAAGPAAAGSAAVLAVGAGLTGFETGAWRIPSIMPALLHPDEMVVPKGPAEAFRQVMTGGSSQDGGDQGGGDIHIHVHAIDTGHGAQYLMRNSKTIAKAIQHEIRTGNRDLHRAAGKSF